MSLPDRSADLERALHERFGLEEFRPGQREVIENVLQGRDVLCVMPTGGGKSLCYQLPAVLLPGMTLVVSPLIALMKDQVDALSARGVRATLINSTLDPAEQRARILEIEAGHYDLVYVAPERFRSGRFVQMMARIKPALLAIDEAHCISEWGHDFRPDYARIGLARKKLGSPPCIALTATATDMVRRDIADQLDLRDPAIFVTGFDRPNLTYAAFEGRGEADKIATLVRTLDENPGPSIVYASSRKGCEAVAEHLRHELRREVVVYHAGLTRQERHDSQERFMNGDAEVVVATNAFGMGVDKADIRSVVHYNMPGTLEAYYQEAGRGGRDGLPARCVLIHAMGDRKLQEMFIENEYPPAAAVFQVYEFLRKLDADPIELTQVEIKEAAGIELNESAVGTSLKLLEGAEAIERFMPRENMAIVRINTGSDDPATEPASLVDRLGPQAHVQRIVLLGLEGLVNRRYSEPVYFHPDDFATALGLERTALVRAIRALTAELPIDYVPPFRGNAIRVIDRKRRPRDLVIDFASLQKRKNHEYDKLDRMIRYAHATQCRRAFLLSYFGDAHAARMHCGRCDNCGSDGEAAAPARTISSIDSAAGHEVILKVLSGVARAKGRFGKTVVAQMLKGSGAEKMDRWGLTKLSTFGILSHFSQPELTQILDALAGAGMLEYVEVDRFRPVVNLTDAGWDWLKTRPDRPILLAIPAEIAAKICGSPGETPRRAESAVEDPEPGPGNVRRKRPAPSAASGAPVDMGARAEALAGLYLQQPDAGRNGQGPSANAAGTLGDQRRRAVEARAIRQGDSGGDRRELGPSPRRRRPESPIVATEEWTWRLVERGFTLDEASAIRGLDRMALIGHLVISARQGKAISMPSLLDAQTLRRWEAWRNENGDETPPFDDAGPLDLWPLFIAARKGR